MGKYLTSRALKVAFIMTIICIMTIEMSFADTLVSEERTTVRNMLPDMVIYADTDTDCDLTIDNTKAYVNDKEAEVEWAGTFEETGEGTVYYVMVDISRSISEDDFQLIKESILDFTSVLSDKDTVRLIPFGESVYTDETDYSPGTEELTEAVNAMALKDDYTQLYAAMDAVAVMTDSGEGNGLGRNIAMVFTDGLDDTTGGLVTRDEAILKMEDAAVPLYAFAVGNDKSGKDSLGVVTRSTGGDIWDLGTVGGEVLTGEFKKIIDKSATIKVKVKNSEDISDSFTVRITKNGKEFLVVEDVRAHKSEDSKDSFSVAAMKMLDAYWWVIVIIAVALTAFIVLMVIKKNKGIVNIDGKIVYGSKVQRKYHMRAEELNSRDIVLAVSINGSKIIEQSVTVTESIIVGRSDTCDVYFDDISVSRQHFCLELEEGNFYVTDLESTGGTYLNGVRIASKQRVSSGDVIDAGRVRIKIIF